MKLLLTGAFKCTDEQIEYLKSLGHDIVFFGDERESLILMSAILRALSATGCSFITI